VTPTFLIWIFAAGVLASLLFSTVSYSLRSLSRVQLEQALHRHRRSHALEAILTTRDDLALTAAILRLAANTTAMVAVAWYFLMTFWNDPHPLKVFGSTILVTVPALLIFSVAIPQAWARYAGESMLARVWPLVRVLHVFIWPFARVLHVFDELVRRLAGVSIGDDPDTAAEAVEQEILSVVAEGTAEGTVDEEQKKMIEGIISFRDLQVSQIMTPRTDVVAVDVNAPIGEVRDKILKEGLSRVPVFEGTLDNIVGILYAKDLLKFLDTANVGSEAQPPKVAIEVRKIMRPPLFVPPTKPLHDLLREFRIQQVHMAVVLDEYGGTSGLVTTEDILEEIVGDIVDEYEHPETLQLKHLDDHTVEVDARMNIAELNRTLGLALPEDGDYQTIGGFVISTLGAIPPRGERLDHEGVGVIVIDSEPRRVKKVRLELPERDATTAGGGDGGAENVPARA
jgi:CBS domain containing-hemolysin-like protein